MKTIITIGRQFGSGGHDIGKMVAERLNIPFYDKELITLAAKEHGYAPEIFEKADETASNSFLYALSTGAFMVGHAYNAQTAIPITDKLYIAQSNIIKEAAEKGSCVIVGRCADSVLMDDPALVSVFIHADLQNRIRRIMKKYDTDESKAHEMIRKNDKRRANYYNFYSSKKWSNTDSYHLAIDSGVVNTEGAAQLICDFVKIREESQNKH